MELKWYFIALAGVVTCSWCIGQVEAEKAWAVWTFNRMCQGWENVWTRLMRHLGPDSPYTHKPKHGGKQ